MTDYKKFIELINSFNLTYESMIFENFICVVFETDVIDDFQFFYFDEQTKNFCEID